MQVDTETCRENTDWSIEKTKRLLNGRDSFDQSDIDKLDKALCVDVQVLSTPEKYFGRPTAREGSADRYRSTTLMIDAISLQGKVSHMKPGRMDDENKSVLESLLEYLGKLKAFLGQYT